MTKSQTVTLFPNEPMTGTQVVSYDKKDGWLTITHNGEELSMHEYNFLRLVDLVNDARLDTKSK